MALIHTPHINHFVDKSIDFHNIVVVAGYIMSFNKTNAKFTFVFDCWRYCLKRIFGTCTVDLVAGLRVIGTDLMAAVGSA